MKRIKLTTTGELIKELKKLPKETEVYANGTYGYMHIASVCISFDDNPLDDLYEKGVT